MHKIDLNLLDTFFAVYKLRSYTKAAAALQCTPSNVRQKILRLEALTGSNYFSKQGKSLAPTYEAEALNEKAYKHFHALELEVSTLQSNETGKQHLEILTSTGASMLWTVSVIETFTKTQGEISFGVHTSEQKLAHEMDAYDVLILPQNMNHPQFLKLKMGEFPTQLYASKQYLKQHGMPTSPEELDQHRMISFYHSSDAYRGDMDWSLRAGRPLSDPRTPFLVLNNMMGISFAVASGIGIGALTPNCPLIEAHKLIQVLPDSMGRGAAFYFYFNTALANNPFIKHVKTIKTCTGPEIEAD